MRDACGYVHSAAYVYDFYITQQHHKTASSPIGPFSLCVLLLLFAFLFLAIHTNPSIQERRPRRQKTEDEGGEEEGERYLYACAGFQCRVLLGITFGAEAAIN